VRGVAQRGGRSFEHEQSSLPLWDAALAPMRRLVVGWRAWWAGPGLGLLLQYEQRRPEQTGALGRDERCASWTGCRWARNAEDALT
jgi:hypothetical protein